MSAALGNAQVAIEAALRSAGLSDDVASCRDLSGGCIHRVVEVRLADGERVVVKVNDAAALRVFEEEAVSLRALEATKTVVVPRVLAVGAHGGFATLLMTRIEPPSRTAARGEEAMWRAFGEDLAALHLAPLPPELARGYGFVSDNHLGATPQPNAWRDDWIEFNAEHRLGHQVRLARQRDLLSADETKRIDLVIAGLDRTLPRRPRPSLLHGDLWSGNALPTEVAGRATMAVIDPASYVGDALADIAMMRLFGGFDQACFDTWSQHMSVDLASEEAMLRIAAYQLYHVLNHVNLFGRGYANQAMSLAAALTR